MTTEYKGEESLKDVGASLAGWAKRVGIESPAVFIVTASLEKAVSELRRNLGGKISFSTKANTHKEVLEVMLQLVDECNVTNLEHLEVLLTRGLDPGRIVFAHPVVEEHIAGEVIAKGVRRFVVDDMRGLNTLNKQTKDLSVSLRLAVPSGSGWRRSMTRFGGTISELRNVAREAVKNDVHLEGLSFYVGTGFDQERSAGVFGEAIARLSTLKESLEKDGIAVNGVNIGGGFPGSQRGFYKRHPEFFSDLREDIGKKFGRTMPYTSEPGRYLVESGMVALGRVIHDRKVGERERQVFLNLSGYGMLFESSFVEPDGGDPVLVVPSTVGSEASLADVVGPIMDSFDVIKKNAKIPRMKEGDWVVIPNVGAYSWDYGTSAEGLKKPIVEQMPEDLARRFSSVLFP